MRILTPKVERIGSYTALVGESAIWHRREDALLWVDIVGRRLLRTKPTTGETEHWEFPEMTGFVQPAGDGTWLVGQHHHVLRFDPATGNSSLFTQLEPAATGNRTNDAACDRQGRLWLGTMPLPETGLAPVGTLYRIEKSGKVQAVERGLTIPNGIAFSPDGRTIYWADTPVTPHQVWKARYDPETGTPGKKEIFAYLPEGGGRPDGATVDADGCYWIAAVRGGQLLRYRPDGRLDVAVRVPVSRPSKIAFGGTDLKTIFVTSISNGLSPEERAREPLAGALLALEVGIQGLQAVEFAAF